MKGKIAESIAKMARNAADRTVGKSFYIGSYEIKPPKELLNKKKGNKE